MGSSTNHATGCAHRSPDPDCHCGFNAWFDIGKAERNYQGVIGAVAGAGKTELHNEGFRSSEAQILCLFSEERSAELEKISKKYGVPVFSDRQEFLDYLILFRESTKRVIEDFELDTTYESETPPAAPVAASESKDISIIEAVLLVGLIAALFFLLSPIYAIIFLMTTIIVALIVT